MAGGPLLQQELGELSQVSQDHVFVWLIHMLASSYVVEQRSPCPFAAGWSWVVERPIRQNKRDPCLDYWEDARWRGLVLGRQKEGVQSCLMLEPALMGRKMAGRQALPPRHLPPLSISIPFEDDPSLTSSKSTISLFNSWVLSSRVRFVKSFVTFQRLNTNIQTKSQGAVVAFTEYLCLMMAILPMYNYYATKHYLIFK